MRRLLFLLCLWACYPSFAQVEKIDSIRSLLPVLRDTSLINSYLNIAVLYRRVSGDSMYYYGHKAHDLSVKLNYIKGEARSNSIIGFSELKRCNLLAGLNLCQSALVLATAHHFKEIEADVLSNIGLIHNYQGDYPTALEYYQKALSIGSSSKSVTAGIINNIGGLYY